MLITRLSGQRYKQLCLIIRCNQYQQNNLEIHKVRSNIIFIQQQYLSKMIQYDRSMDRFKKSLSWSIAATTILFYFQQHKRIIS
ncbi:hypothetical protein pb186bvf_020503 [Paramecium bursaria]